MLPVLHDSARKFGLGSTSDHDRIKMPTPKGPFEVLERFGTAASVAVDPEDCSGNAHDTVRLSVARSLERVRTINAAASSRRPLAASMNARYASYSARFDL